MTATTGYLETTLEQSLESVEIAICIKDSGKRVLSQNEYCRRICGDQSGKVCNQGCMALYASDRKQQWKDWGPRVYRNSLIHDSFHDVTLLCSAEHIITFLQPLSEKHAQALEYFRGKGLTRRETQIISHVIQGISNTSICKRLAISKATLRTHLNNIYRKFRERGELPEFIPANRLSD
ncbi:MAG: helix-turn-helix transcriptional regulator [Gammaproteobacteria bacterium]|nr:MAG: helix-turn-helix transcriptional regulator [Gammaproteobacteria bacterium]